MTWFNLSDDDLFHITTALPELGARLHTEAKENSDPDAQKYRDAVPVSDGDLECDDGAPVSRGDDPGAYVMIWKWVDAGDAGVENILPVKNGECTVCGRDFRGDEEIGEGEHPCPAEDCPSNCEEKL